LPERKKKEKSKKEKRSQKMPRPALACLLKHRVNDRTEYRAVPVCDEDEDREKKGKTDEEKGNNVGKVVGIQRNVTRCICIIMAGTCDVSIQAPMRG